MKKMMPLKIPQKGKKQDSSPEKIPLQEILTNISPVKNTPLR